jgi:hypothetical protein
MKSKKAFFSVILMSIIVIMSMLSVYYIEMISLNKKSLQLMHDSLQKDIEEFNSFQ